MKISETFTGRFIHDRDRTFELGIFDYLAYKNPKGRYLWDEYFQYFRGPDGTFWRIRNPIKYSTETHWL